MLIGFAFCAATTLPRIIRATLLGCEMKNISLLVACLLLAFSSLAQTNEQKKPAKQTPSESKVIEQAKPAGIESDKDKEKDKDEKDGGGKNGNKNGKK